jgi:pyridoxal phosphate enzyme (YggS family)
VTQPSVQDAHQVAERLAEVRERIQRAGGVGVKVVAVTKTFGVDAIIAAAAAGCDAIGENYAQELVAKASALAQRPPVHFIGQLQSNKVRLIAPYVDVFETVDRISIAGEIAKRSPGARVLVQVITPNDDGSVDLGKGGCRLGDVAAIVDACRSAGLAPLGAMTVGPTGASVRTTVEGFRSVRRLVDDLGLSVCSMGMSDDLEVAVGEGSTQVRVGSALFGARPPRD